MTLRRLSISNLRNLAHVDIEPDSQVNLFYGANGSGKTSILEAISLLALGRSFRSHKHKTLIRYDAPAFTVFGRVTNEAGEVPLGISRTQQGEASFKAGGDKVSSAADLALYLPTQVINADTFQLLEGGPQVRRQFMDWLVFHVEPSFYPLWKQAQQCLKHRNSLLRRDRIDPFELDAWDQELAGLSASIDTLRQVSLARYLPVLYEQLEGFACFEGLTLTYFAGWDTQKPYSEVLAHSRDRDMRLSTTHYGIHRGDIRIMLNGLAAADTLSRGQQKLLVCAMKVAQAKVYADCTGRQPVFLVDDLPAELDDTNRQALVDWLHHMGNQVFITGVEQSALVASWAQKPEIHPKVFHVEHGQVTAHT